MGKERAGTRKAVMLKISGVTARLLGDISETPEFSLVFGPFKKEAAPPKSVILATEFLKHQLGRFMHMHKSVSVESEDDRAEAIEVIKCLRDTINIYQLAKLARIDGSQEDRPVLVPAVITRTAYFALQENLKIWNMKKPDDKLVFSTLVSDFFEATVTEAWVLANNDEEELHRQIMIFAGLRRS